MLRETSMRMRWSGMVLLMAAAGCLFRADENGDGVVTPEEGRKVRAELMSQSPAAAALFQEARRTTGKSAFATPARPFDVDYGKRRLTLKEFQAALQEPAKVAFAMADTNNDGQLTEEEGARAMGQLVRRLGIQPPGPQ
jgi:hypothetical protein